MFNSPSPRSSPRSPPRSPPISPTNSNHSESFDSNKVTNNSVTLNKTKSENGIDIFGDENEELSDVIDKYTPQQINPKHRRQRLIQKRRPRRKTDDIIREDDIEKNENERNERITQKNPELAPLLESRRIVDEDFAEFLPKKRGRKSKNDEIALEKLNDEEAERLCQIMLRAADDDVRGVDNGDPCHRKINMLDAVVERLSKPYLTEALIDNNILDAVRYWLEPLPDRTLPSITLQLEMMKILDRYPITTDNLLSSKVGRIVYFYKISSRTSEVVRQLATRLVEKWSRPILGLSDDYREIAAAHFDFYRDSGQQSNEDHEPTQSHSISTDVNQARNFHVHRKEDPYRSLKQTMRRLERGTKKN
ncbi:1627_t:CDS:2 [Entrophospora sp. SA101]|nr:1627_t:CDS:2 [Entrophospora sp. SA101]